MRKILPLNDKWCFYKSADRTGTGEPVSLPHTWNAKDGQDGGNDYYRGTCWYVRELACPALEDGQRVWLQCKGAAMSAEVWLNGKKLIRHEGGYSAFRVDLTDCLRESNELAISVDNSENDRVYPQKADFTFYGGLYRDVDLVIVPAAHFELSKDGTPGIKVTPEVDLAAKTAVITVETWQTGADTVSVTVAGQCQTVPSVEGHAAARFTLENVHLWDGVNDPYLYTAVATLTSGDEISTRFGCRTIAFDPNDGFILNGRSYQLRGVSRHQDRWEIGNALTMAEHEEDIAIIKEIGANTVRLAHYQHAQEFYDLCDENGLVVWAEIPYITQHMPNGRQNTLDQMRELITQCCNHPCIVCWGLSNEITASSAVDEDLLENHRLLAALCKKMDSTRPTAMAHAFMLETDSPLLPIADLASYNLYFGWYLGELEQNDRFFDEYHTKFPERCIGFSEYGADANPQFQSAAPDKGDYTEQYQCVYHEYILRCIDQRPFLWATHVWNLFDFAADGRDEGGKNGQNQKGLVTFDRKLKKDAFYLYKAAWNHAEPFVHICGRRYVDRTEDVTEIKVYSNQPEITLVVDCQPLTSKAGNCVFTFQVPITGQHTIEAKAGTYTDCITIRKAVEPNPNYRFGKAGEVINWFDKDDLKSDHFSIQDKLGDLLAHPGTGPIVSAMMEKASASRGDVAKSAHSNPNLQRMMSGMSLQSLLKQAGDTIPPNAIKQLNAALQKFKK